MMICLKTADLSGKITLMNYLLVSEKFVPVSAGLTKRLLMSSSSVAMTMTKTVKQPNSFMPLYKINYTMPLQEKQRQS